MGLYWFTGNSRERKKTNGQFTEQEYALNEFLFPLFTELSY